MNSDAESMSHLPTLSPTIPNGTLNIMENVGAMATIVPSKKVEALSSSAMKREKIGDINSVIQ